MSGRQEMTDIAGVLGNYFDGLYYADSKKLAAVFHPDARYINVNDGDYMNYSMAEYLAVIDERTPPAENGEARLDKILSIEFGNSRMAFAKLSMHMLGRQYLDFLTLTFDDGQWRIMSKVFSYTIFNGEINAIRQY